MTSLDRRINRVNNALREADDILTQQDQCHFRLKVGDILDRRIVVLGDNGCPLTEPELQTGPIALKNAWCSLIANRLLRIAIYYRLFFSDELCGSDEESKPRPSRTREDTLTLGVYDITETDRPDSQKTAEDSFADAVEVYTRRLEEVDPRRAARLRRAIRGGCLEADSDDLFIEGEENWLPWVVAAEMPQRKDFHDTNLTSEAQSDAEDLEFRRPRILGEGIRRGIAAGLSDIATSVQQDSETVDYTEETDGELGKTQAIKRLFELAKPIVNVYALPTFGEFAFMCAAGTIIVCVVLMGFGLLRLL